MSRGDSWRCEGCGVESDLRAIDDLRWIKIRISHRGESSLLDAEMELCPTCQVRLLENANPRTWQRPPASRARDR